MKYNILLFALFCTMSLVSQTFSIELKVKPEVNYTLTTLNTAIQSNSSLSAFGINALRKVYPNSNSAYLDRIYVLKGNGNVDTAISRLANMNIYSFVKKDGLSKAGICTSTAAGKVNDTRIINGSTTNYPLNLIEAPCAWDITRGDPRIEVGIADSDFDLNHEELVGKIAFIGGANSAGNPHGTYVAGAAVCNTNNNRGIAAIGYNSRVALCRIPHTTINGQAWANFTDIASAIWTLHQRNTRIINISFHGTGLDPVAAQTIVDAGNTIVTIAGNDVGNTSSIEIAPIPGVILVSGVNANNQIGPTGFARNQWVEIVAPSIGVGTLNTGNSYIDASGTSLAAPIVAGTIGLMRAINPCLTPPQIETILKNTCDPLADGSTYPGLFGSGRVNAFSAVQQTLIQGTLFQQNRLATGTTKYPTGNTTLWGNTRIVAGRSVTTGTIGNVVIPNGSNVKYEANVSVDLHDGFEVMTGSTFEINVRSSTCY